MIRCDKATEGGAFVAQFFENTQQAPVCGACAVACVRRWVVICFTIPKRVCLHQLRKDKILTRRTRTHLGVLLVTASTLAVQTGYANVTEGMAGLNGYGMPGLVEMPTALSLPDAQIAATVFESSSRRMVTLTFQGTPRLSGAFRYGRFEGFIDGILYDRSFDLQYRLKDEVGPWPALAIGLRDMVGTAVNGA